METTSKAISIPSYWAQPKYSLGQRIKQGTIVGIQYQLPNNLLLESSADGSWNYIVKVNSGSKDKDKEVEELQEHEIKTLPSSDLHKLLTAEIEAYQQKIEILKQQLPSL
jgi:hypothetical protein